MAVLERQIKWEEGGFWYRGAYRTLSETAILVTGSLSVETAARPYVYHDIREAFDAVERPGDSLDRPVTIYLMPDVYWIDDPKAEDVLQKREGYPLPFGLYVTCGSLRIEGLSENAKDVVIAGNRGQSHGCNGNYTMFYFQVEELTVENITLGNYCSVDLTYPKDPAKNYPRRTDTITQAQLAIQKGEKLHAKNCRFVSRLNLTPICGGERALYENCHFESTDDALNGNAVYVGCDFDFYGNRPLYQAKKTGAVFVDCQFHSRIKSADGESFQYLTKEGGPVTLINCRYDSSENVKLGWTKYPQASLKCYQYQVTQNGVWVTLGGKEAAETVQLQGKKALEAYLFRHDGREIVNLGNLLGGGDDWDPAGTLQDAKKENVTGIPTQLSLTTERDTIISGEKAAVIKAEVSLFSHESCRGKVIFSLRKEDEGYARLEQDTDQTCRIEGRNDGPGAREVVVSACTESGLEAAAAITVEPYPIPAPVCLEKPVILKTRESCGREAAAQLHYELSPAGREDISKVSWYRCDNEAGEGAALCAVSKGGIPLRIYRLTEADVGKYLKALLVPQLRGSLQGDPVAAITQRPVSGEDVDFNRLFTDFSDWPEENQTENRKGCWIQDCAKPVDIQTDSATFGSWSMDESIPAWKYGETGNGSIGAGLYQNTQGARLRYAPVRGHRGTMRMTVQADPAKTAGQGFGSAGQYLDLGIKFDTERLNGYALRVIRIKEASDAVAMALVEYRDGRSRYLTKLQQTSCFLTGCTLKIAWQDGKLTAEVFTKLPQPAGKGEKGYVHEVKLEADAAGNCGDGILIWHTGTPGTGGWQNTTMLHRIEVEYGD